MRQIFWVAIICFGFATSVRAQEPSGSTPYGQPQLQYVDVNDALVLAAANFAAQQMQRGSLSKIIFAQWEGREDGNIYVLTLEVVDAHLNHHRYSAQVFMPQESNQWQLIYFTPADR